MQYQQILSVVLYKLDQQNQGDLSQVQIHRLKFDSRIDLIPKCVVETMEYFRHRLLL